MPLQTIIDLSKEIKVTMRAAKARGVVEAPIQENIEALQLILLKAQKKYREPANQELGKIQALDKNYKVEFANALLKFKNTEVTTKAGQVLKDALINIIETQIKEFDSPQLLRAKTPPPPTPSRTPVSVQRPRSYSNPKIRPLEVASPAVVNPNLDAKYRNEAEELEKEQIQQLSSAALEKRYEALNETQLAKLLHDVESMDLSLSERIKLFSVKKINEHQTIFASAIEKIAGDLKSFSDDEKVSFFKDNNNETNVRALLNAKIFYANQKEICQQLDDIVVLVNPPVDLGQKLLIAQKAYEQKDPNEMPAKHTPSPNEAKETSQQHASQTEREAKEAERIQEEFASRKEELKSEEVSTQIHSKLCEEIHKQVGGTGMGSAENITFIMPVNIMVEQSPNGIVTKLPAQKFNELLPKVLDAHFAIGITALQPDGADYAKLELMIKEMVNRKMTVLGLGPEAKKLLQDRKLTEVEFIKKVGGPEAENLYKPPEEIPSRSTRSKL